MTDLDMKIAELKGWVFRPEMAIIVSPDGSQAIGILVAMLEERPINGLNWSTDIAKAFELVDEVCGVTFTKGAFVLLTLAQEPKDFRWLARFHFQAKEFDGAGATRPEAICRAYIAMKEWERKK